MNPAQAIEQMISTEADRAEGSSSARCTAPTAAWACPFVLPLLVYSPLTTTNPPPPLPPFPQSTPAVFLTGPAPGVLDPNETLLITLSRLGTASQSIRSGTLGQLGALTEADFGGPLHSLVIVGKRVHPLEVEYAGGFAVDYEQKGKQGEFWRVAKDVLKVELEGDE